MLSECLEQFVLARRSEGATDATVTWYEWQVGYLRQWLTLQGDPPLTPIILRRYFVYLRDRHKAPGADGKAKKPMRDASIVSAHRALRSFFKWCQAEGLIEQSPMIGVKIKPAEPHEPRRATRAEVDKLLRSIPVDGWLGLRDFLIVHILFMAGLRGGGLVLLEERHFDLENQVLHVPAGKSGPGVVPMVHSLIEAFMAYQAHRPQGITDKLLISANGKGVPKGALTASGVRQMLANRCEEAGIRRLNPHSFRHGVAMHLLNDKRVDATLVQKILRHASLRTTTTFYAHWLVSALGDEYRNVMEG